MYPVSLVIFTTSFVRNAGLLPVLKGVISIAF